MVLDVAPLNDAQ